MVCGVVVHFWFCLLLLGVQFRYRLDWLCVLGYGVWWMVVRRGDECVSLLYIYRCRVFQGFYKKNLPRFCCVFHLGLCSAFFFRYGLWCCCRFLVLLAVMRPLILSSLGFTLCFGFWCVVNGSERARWMCLPFTSVEYFRVCRKKRCLGFVFYVILLRFRCERSFLQLSPLLICGCSLCRVGFSALVITWSCCLCWCPLSSCLSFAVWDYLQSCFSIISTWINVVQFGYAFPDSTSLCAF